MIRERRNREKLQGYYRKFIDKGILDPNVHPWVAEAWQRSLSLKVSTSSWPDFHRLSKDVLAERLKASSEAISYLDSLYEQIREYFIANDLSMLLLDSDAIVLKSYAQPFYQKSPGEWTGVRLAEQDIGASSISVAMEQKTPFLLFGPEIWIQECHMTDACSAPIIVEGEVRFIITFVVASPEKIPLESIVANLLMIKHSLEKYLEAIEKISDRQAILDALPMAVYQIDPEGEPLYANRLGAERLLKGRKPGESRRLPNLNDAVLNYRHTHIFKGFLGVPSVNKELTWIIGSKTYEDLASVWPIFHHGIVKNVAVLSTPIEELKTLEAHASQYKARYSLLSLVGQASSFIAMKDKATRAARHLHNILLVGEPGTGKQRLAHGIHQSGPRAAGPLITLRCGEVPPELLSRELFGSGASSGEALPGKIALAQGGTLFIDEVDKMPAPLGEELARVLRDNKKVRVIAASDIDLRRLTARGLFPESLYLVISQIMIRTPALRNRSADIRILCSDMIAELCEQHQMPPKTLSEEARALLTTYDWPGNIKQLQGVLEQGFFRAQSDVIGPGDVVLPGGTGWGKAWKKDRTIFMDAWKLAGGNISRLATNLGVSRVTLYRYLEKFGLERGK